MAEFIFYFVAFFLGLYIQRDKTLYALKILGFLMAFILPTLINNDQILYAISSLTHQNELSIIITVLSFSVGTSIPFIYRIRNTKKIEKHLELSDYFVSEKIFQLLENIRNELKENPKYFSNDVYISLYFVKRIFRQKRVFKVCRMSHVGMPGFLSDNWNGVIKRYKYTSLGNTIRNQTYDIVNYKDIDTKDFIGIPTTIINWLRQNAIYSINAPFTKDNKVVFIITITGIDKNFNWDNLTEKEKRMQVDLARKILIKYDCNIDALYDYCNCIL